MKRWIAFVITALLCGLPMTSGAMEIRIEGDRAYLSGEVDYPDFNRLEDAFNKGVKVLVLQGLGSARVEAAQAVGGFVGKAGVTTVAIGPCAGSCPYLFLRGKERYFAESQPGRPQTALYVVGARFTGDLTGPAMANNVYSYFRDHLAPVVPSDLISRYTTEWTEGKALLFFAPNPKLARGAVTECANIHEPKSCKRVAGLDLLSAGVLSSEARYKL